MYELRHLRESRAAKTALDHVARGLRAEMLMRPGIRGAFAEAVAADPTFGYAHAGLAALDLVFGHRPQTNTAAATAAADGASDPERATIHLVDRCTRLPVADRMVEARIHLETYPDDLLAIILAAASLQRGTAGPVAGVEMMESLLLAQKGHWWVKGLLATWLVDVRRIRDAWRYANESLTEEPAAWHAAHAVAHLAYTADDHRGGARWLDSWQVAHQPRGYARAHFAWHVALGRLATGDAKAAADSMINVLTPTSPQAGVDSIELATASWLCLADGDSSLHLRVGEAVRRRAGQLVALPSAMRTVAAGMLLAGAGCRAELHQLVSLAGGSSSPTYRDVVVPLLHACEGLLDGDPTAVIAALGVLAPDAVAQLGGSNAEQDVVERCLLYAMRRALAAKAPAPSQAAAA